MEPTSQANLNLIEMFGTVFAALIGVVSIAVGSLCYFLRQLVHTAIPEQGERFERVATAQLAEMKAQREECQRSHREHERRADERHKEHERRADERHQQVLEVLDITGRHRPPDRGQGGNHHDPFVGQEEPT